MPRYERIFWLDDCPDVLGNLLSIGKKFGLERESLLPRITWAYDSEMGANIVKQHDFDLYILDGDFPDTTSNEQKKSIDDFLTKVNHSLLWVDSPLPSCGYDTIDSNFARFSTTHLQNKTPVVIFSMSTIAPVSAFHLSLPFYGKAIPKWGVLDSAQRRLTCEDTISPYIPKNLRKTQPGLAQWEHGDWEEFIQK